VLGCGGEKEEEEWRGERIDYFTQLTSPATKGELKMEE
jgi:hypothetical protein